MLSSFLFYFYQRSDRLLGGGQLPKFKPQKIIIIENDIFGHSLLILFLTKVC